MSVKSFTPAQVAQRKQVETTGGIITLITMAWVLANWPVTILATIIIGFATSGATFFNLTAGVVTFLVSKVIFRLGAKFLAGMVQAATKQIMAVWAAQGYTPPQTKQKSRTLVQGRVR